MFFLKPDNAIKVLQVCLFREKNLFKKNLVKSIWFLVLMGLTAEL